MLFAALAVLAGSAATPCAGDPLVATSNVNVGYYGVDPTFLNQARNNIVTWDGVAVGDYPINMTIGATRFMSAYIWGQYSAVANVEAGHIWNGHETLSAVWDYYTPAGALGETDIHATAVGMLIAGLGPPDPTSGGYYYYQMGIAPFASLSSGAIATEWSSTNVGSFSVSDATFYNTYRHFFADSFFRSYGTSYVYGPYDVINSSWGGSEPTGMDSMTLAADGFARAHPQTTFVVAAGNAGTANSVGNPASGYNSISVGATGNGSLNDFSMVASFSSRGPQDYYDSVHGLVTGVRAPVDIVAPGTSLATAYYGGVTGSNRYSTEGDVTGGSGSYYTVGASGTSFSAPIVSGGVALLTSASYIYGMSAESRDSRVIKAVLMSSADKLPGWSNGQHADGSGVVVTTQSLDWAQGAGQINLDRAYDQYVAGTADVAGTGGGSVMSSGWDLGSLTMSTDEGVTSHNDYPIAAVLQHGSILDVTLSWFRDRSEPTLDLSESLVTSDDGFANLDLEIWSYDFSKLYATSMSQYNSSEHLFFALPADGLYGIRVSYAGQMFGTPVAETYGLAWNNFLVAVPEPGTLSLLLGAGLAVGWVVRRRRGHRRRVKIS